MQVIEKVKVVPEGYNGAGMDGMYGRRDVNGKANAGLTLGIIGTALGAWALFGNRRSAGVLGTGTGLILTLILVSLFLVMVTFLMVT
jgi:hypothetical protein